MRCGGVLLILLLAVTNAGAFTVIMKNGNTMEGVLLSEAPESIQFRDIYGIQYTLKKELLNIPEMMDANPEARIFRPPVSPEQSHATSTIVRNKRPTLAEIARENLKNRTGKAPVLRNTRPPEILPSWPKSGPELQDWIARTEQELQRQASRCRAAGGSPSAKHSYREDTYIVQGKPVVVSGYWADPEEVESSRRICAEAMSTEKALELARKDLDEIEKKAPLVDGEGVR